MKGHLYRTEIGKWFVNHEGKVIPLHPEIELTPTPFNNYGEGCEVNFVIVDEFTHPNLFLNTGWGDGPACAWLVNELKEEELLTHNHLTTLKKIEKENPNDMDFGKKVRKLLKNILG